MSVDGVHVDGEPGGVDDEDEGRLQQYFSHNTAHSIM